jgi:uncharacterized protein
MAQLSRGLRLDAMPDATQSTLITATSEAAAVLGRLVGEHGSLVLFQSGGCCDGSLPLCLLADDLAPGPGDKLLGEVDGVPFYIDADQFERWGRPQFVLDVVSGAPEGFSLGLPDAHFVTRSPSCPIGPA